MAKPPVVKSARKEPFFQGIMAMVKAASSWTDKLQYAGAPLCYAGDNQAAKSKSDTDFGRGGATKPVDKQTRLRRVATRLVLEDMLGTTPSAADAVNVLVAGLAGYGNPAEWWQPSSVDAAGPMPIQDALAVAAMVDPQAAVRLTSWIGDAVSRRRGDVAVKTADHVQRAAAKGAQLPAKIIANAAEPLLPWGQVALGLGVLYGAWRMGLFGRKRRDPD